jgi:hypothetical protein
MLGMKKSAVVLSLLIILLLTPSALSRNSFPRSGVVLFSMHSGEPNPYCELSEDDVAKLMSMVNIKLRDAVEIDSFPDNIMDPKASLRGIQANIWEIDPSKKSIDSRVYPSSHKMEVMGEYIQIQDGKRSTIYKMNSAELESYLIKLGVRKSAIHDWQEKMIYNDIGKRKE